MSENYLAQYIHDLIVFDQGKSLPIFYHEALKLKKSYQDPEELKLSLRTLAKTFWIKDEGFVSHMMISPLKINRDQERYSKLGTHFKVIHINRPAFDLLGKKIEFDFSPKKWMLLMMRHFRVLRVLMPDWHKHEKDISTRIRSEILSGKLSLKRLNELDQIKGYRSVRYKAASQVLGIKYE